MSETPRGELKSVGKAKRAFRQNFFLRLCIQNGIIKIGSESIVYLTAKKNQFLFLIPNFEVLKNIHWALI